MECTPSDRQMYPWGYIRVPSKPKKKRHFRHFFWMPADKNFENRHLHIFGRNFLHWRKFHNTEFQHFFKNVWDIFSRLKPFSGHSIESSDAFWKFSACKVCKEDLGAVSQFLRLTTKLFAVKFRCIFCVICLQVCKNVLGAFSRFLHAKTKLFALKSRRILEVFTLQLHKKKF